MVTTTRRRSPVMPEPRATLGQRARDRARRKLHEWTHPHRCDACNRDFRGHKALNAHHLGVHAQRWTSKKARAAARAMGKDVDRARRHARGWLEASGLLDARGNLTPRALSRPRPKLGPRGRASVRQMRKMHVHARDHDKADRYDRRASRSRIPARRDWLEHRAARRRERWAAPARPAARPAPVRPVPASPPVRPAPAANGNGTRPAPARPAPAPPARTAPSGGRLAPSRNGRTTR